MLQDISIISVLGGPGAGKGTLCSSLQAKFQCAHFSVGDLLRAEAAKIDSPYRETIQKNMAAGLVGPKEITVAILERSVQEAYDQGMRTFFLDGFPRKVDQAELFEERVARISFVLVLDCSAEVMKMRVSQRRRDDNDGLRTTIKRIETFEGATAEVVRRYDAIGNVVRVCADADVNTVRQEVERILGRADLTLEERLCRDMAAAGYRTTSSS